MRLGLDLETSGLYREALPPEHPSQPWICQFGAIVFDASWRPVSKLVALIQPKGWSIEAEAEKHHHISDAMCQQFGTPIESVLLIFQHMTRTALQGFAHNAAFERKLIHSQIIRLGIDPGWFDRWAKDMACTMTLSTKPCAMPGEFGLKFPALHEAKRHFRPDLPSTPTSHEAEADILDAAVIAEGLQKIGSWPALFEPGFRMPS